MNGIKLRSESGNFLIREQKVSSTQKRGMQISNVEEKETGILEFSISSDEPYERWFGTEILSHKDGAVNLIRLNNSANILYNHNRDDYIAVCIKGWLQDGKTRVRTKWNLENPDYSLPKRIYTDVAAGILKNTSVGYSYDELLFEEKDGQDIITATRWTPFEGSIVTVPADHTVGVGRSYFDLAQSAGEAVGKPPNWEELEQRVDAVTETVDNFISGVRDMGDENSSTTLEVTREEDLIQERERAEAIYAAGHKYNCPDLAQKALKEGWSVAEFRSQILESGQQQKPVARTTDPLGMSEKEQKDYSLTRAIEAALNGHFRNAGFEKEIHDELVKKAKETYGYTESKNVLIPVYDLSVNHKQADETYASMARSAAYRNYLNHTYYRNQQIGDPQLGGNLVETELLAERFIDIFRNKSILRRMGMQSLTGLIGNVDIPKQISGAIDGNSVYWVGEDVPVGKIAARFGLVKLRPKNVGSYMYMTRSMLLHSSIGMNNFCRRELAIALALGMDRAGISGTGINEEPLGILNIGGVNVVIFGPDGGIPSWEKLVQFETKIATANADERTMGWALNSRMRGELKSRQKFAGTNGETLWQNAMVGSNEGYVNGYRVGVSNQIPGNLVKGNGTNLNAMIFGDWSRLICGEWGTYELAANPFTDNGFLSGGIQVRIIHTCDFAVTQEKAFSVATDVSTPFSDAA